MVTWQPTRTASFELAIKAASPILSKLSLDLLKVSSALFFIADGAGVARQPGVLAGSAGPLSNLEE
jgi:hypothetical protein